MTPAETLLQRLSDLPPGPGPHALTTAGGAAVTLDAERFDTIAGVYRGVTVNGPPVESVGAWADGVAGRVKGLLEGLKVIEVDTTRDAAVLRSSEPAVSGPAGGVRRYYEVQLGGDGSASVQRYEADRDAGTPREPIGFALTHEVTARLVEDILG